MQSNSNGLGRYVPFVSWRRNYKELIHTCKRKGGGAPALGVKQIKRGLNIFSI